jgi:hypothetical protein
VSLSKIQFTEPYARAQVQLITEQSNLGWLRYKLYTELRNTAKRRLDRQHIP